MTGRESRSQQAGPLTDSAAAEIRGYAWAWRRLIVAAVIGSAGFLLFQTVDVSVAGWSERSIRLDRDGAIEQIIEGFRNFGQLLTIIAVIVLIGLLDTRRKRIIIALLVAQIGSKVTYEVAKHTIARERPYITVSRPVEDRAAEDTWLGYRLGNTSRDYQSFPSGHSAAAFAFAGVLAWYYRRAGAVFWVLAAGCAATRALNLMHWPSDCVVGAALGYIWAQVGLRCAR